MELSPQETALILSQREARKSAVAAVLAGGLADFLQSYARRQQTPTSALAHINSKS
jgi:hypothetical protein